MNGFKEDHKAPSPIHSHQATTDHPTILSNFSIIGREGQEFARTNKESIFIRVNNPALNGIIDRYNLPHIWDGILNNNPEHQAHRTPLAPPKTLGLYNSRHLHFSSDLKKLFRGKGESLSSKLVNFCLKRTLKNI